MTESLRGPVLVVVPCSAAKLWHAAAAGELYTGTLHRMARGAGDALVEQHGGQVVILSALHGLLALDQVVEPYDLTWGQAGTVSPQTVALQLLQLLQQQRDQAPTVVSLLPRAYRLVLALALQQLPADVRPQLVEPLAGATGVGYQRQRLAQLRTGARPVTLT